jgi:hypothetical protein
MLSTYPSPVIGEMYDPHIDVIKEEEVAYRFRGWFDAEDGYGRVQQWRREARKTTRVTFFLRLSTQKGEVITAPDGEHFRDASYKNDCTRYNKVTRLKWVGSKEGAETISAP